MTKIKMLAIVMVAIVALLVVPVAASGPHTDFSATPTNGVAPLTVQFSDDSHGFGYGDKSYFWSFGDGSFSWNKNPTHKYNNPGIYTVSHCVWKNYDVDWETKVNYIVVTADESGANLNNKDGSWVPITDDGRYGVMTIDEAFDVYSFEGFGLAANTEYSLIYYPDPWGTPIVVIDSGMTNGMGYVMLNGVDYKTKLVLNPADENIVNDDGYKLWLVPSTALNGNAFNEWVPANYLFEVELFQLPPGYGEKPKKSSGSATWVPRLTSVEGGEIVELQGVSENGEYRFHVFHGSILNDVQTVYYQEKGEPYYNKDGERVYSSRTAGELRYSVSGMQSFQIVKPNRMIRLQVQHRNNAYDGLPTFIELKDVSTGEIVWSTVLEEKLGDWTFQI